MSAGYSKRSLVDKLGIKAGMRVAILNAPQDYDSLLGQLPPGVAMENALEAPCDFIHYFADAGDDLEDIFPRLKESLAQAGMLWVSWRKGAKAAGSLNENVIREIGLANGLVDVKVAAVDETWSGLKFVRRLKDRTE